MREIRHESTCAPMPYTLLVPLNQWKVTSALINFLKNIISDKFLKFWNLVCSVATSNPFTQKNIKNCLEMPSTMFNAEEI